MENQIKKLKENLKLQYKKDNRLYVGDDFNIHPTSCAYLSEIVARSKSNEIKLSILLEELSEHYQLAGLYEIYFSGSSTLLSYAAQYIYWMLRVDCEEEKCHFVVFRKALLLSSILLIIGWEKEANSVSQKLIKSLRKQIGMIGYGNRNHPEAWFLIDLLVRSKGEKPFDRKIVDYPDSMENYADVVDEWNIADKAKLDSLIYGLCEQHMLLQEVSSEYDEMDNEDDLLVSIEHPIFRLFPYEILAWLAIRKQHGLKNPTEFSHPLMNTPIAQFFLSLETPLPKPEKLPYVKELLTKLKEKCPEIEINL